MDNNKTSNFRGHCYVPPSGIRQEKETIERSIQKVTSMTHKLQPVNKKSSNALFKGVILVTSKTPIYVWARHWVWHTEIQSTLTAQSSSRATVYLEQTFSWIQTIFLPISLGIRILSCGPLYSLFCTVLHVTTSILWTFNC